MRRLNRKLATEAKEKGVCKEWEQLIKRSKDVDSLLMLYTRGIDFCLDNNFPANDVLLKHKEHLKPHSIFIDEQVEAYNKKIIALGTCIVQAKYDTGGYEVFFKHNSKGKIIVRGDALVVIDLFDNTELILDAGTTSRALVSVYGNAKLSNLNPQGNVKINYKKGNTYDKLQDK